MQFANPRFERIAFLGKAIGGSAGSIALRGFSIVSNIAAVSLSLQLLGPERYGQYVLLMAGATWLALEMLGTGEYFTQILVKQPRGINDPQVLLLVKSNFAYCTLGSVTGAAIGVIGLLILTTIIPLDRPLVIAGLIVVIGSSTSIPLAMASSALIAQGRIGLDAIFKLLQPLSLLAMVTCAYLLPPISPGLMLILLSTAYVISWLITRACAFAMTFEIKVLLRDLFKAPIGPVARGAWPFLVIQLAALLSFQTDRFLISSFSSLTELASYDLLARIFTALYTVFSIPLLHIWRLVGASWQTDDMPRLRRVVRLYSVGAVLFWLAATLAVVLCAPFVIELFSGSSVAALPWSVTALVGAFFLVRGTTDVLTLSLYSMGQEKRLLPFIVAHGLTNVALAAFGGMVGGIVGLLIGQVVSFILSTQMPFMIILERLSYRDAAG